MTSDGWTFEGPDPSVGIFGDLVIHECGTEDEAEELASEARTSNDGAWVVVTRRWRCPACGAETSVKESEPVEWWEEDRDGD